MSGPETFATIDDCCKGGRDDDALDSWCAFFNRLEDTRGTYDCRIDQVLIKVTRPETFCSFSMLTFWTSVTLK